MVNQNYNFILSELNNNCLAERYILSVFDYFYNIEDLSKNYNLTKVSVELYQYFSNHELWGFYYDIFEFFSCELFGLIMRYDIDKSHNEDGQNIDINNNFINSLEDLILLYIEKRENDEFVHYKDMKCNDFKRNYKK